MFRTTGLRTRLNLEQNCPSNINIKKSQKLILPVLPESIYIKKALINLLLISQFSCMRRTYNIRNIISNPQGRKLSSENYGPDQNPSEMKQSSDKNSLNQLISMLKNLIQTSISNKIIQERPKNNYQLEARDREVCIDLPTINDKVQPSELKLWITDVVKTIFSSAFNSFSKKQMSFEQAKIYCSENLFKNIVRLSEKYRLSDLELELIDNHIKKGVLNYLAAKYPLTDSTIVNKKLQGMVRSVDNIESLSNNYFTNSKIVFEFRQSGNYNDLIMEMLNDLMSKPEMKSSEYSTNYQDFRKYMSDIFQKVEDEEWTNQLDKLQPNNSSSLNPDINLQNNETKEETKERDRRKNEEKEKYRAKVKDYTHYLIGRKISENAPLFTPAEIKNGNIQIKNPQILRVLTKWCEELEEKYRNSYFSSRSQSVKLQRGQKINSFLPWMREKLDQMLRDQNKIINTTMSDLFKNNYEMQASVLQNELERQGDEHVDAIQKISGKFSFKVVKNLHSYIIIYLNKLIHGLLKAAKILLFEHIGQDTTWPSPPNLLSFKIGDLMRCKCSSKENEILRIYEEITRVSKENPKKLKIVRIKNRLRSGTNDILMNIRFNDSILCEIQLAIKTTASEFIKCSNMFHHYLYELQRSLFGPLTQLGSIWNSLDKRADIYEELVEQQQNQPKILQNHACLKFNKNYKMRPYDKSFVCNSCKLSYFHNRFIMSHVQCSTCSYILCAKCRIEEQAKTNLQGLLGKQKKFIDICGKLIPKETELPKYGLCVFIETKQPKVEPFTLITYRDIDYLLSKKESKINQISKIRSKKEKSKFRNNFLVFEIISNSSQMLIWQQQAVNNYILPLVMKQNYKKQKETISLMDMKLRNEECCQVLSVGSSSQKQCVKNMFLTDNLLTELPFNPKQFPNVEWITLSRNKMISLKGIEQIHYLNILYMSTCGLYKFPEVFECKELKELCLDSNRISQIDDGIIKLINLQTLFLSNNGFRYFPQSLFECKALTTLTLQNNKLQELPQNIKKLKNLQVLNLQENYITTISQSIGELRKLKIISLAKNNNLTSLPSRFVELKNLQSIDISQTQISEIPCPSEGFAQLKVIKMQNTKVTNFSFGFNRTPNIQLANFSFLPSLSFDNFSLKKIKILEMRNCEIFEMPSIIFEMQNLRTLDLKKNNIQNWGFSFYFKLTLLQSLNLCECKLTNFPNLSNYCSLKTLNIQLNDLTQISDEKIEGLVNLEEFNCQQNKLTVLPTSLTKLKKLKWINANVNHLETLFDPEFQSTFNGTQYWPELNTVKLNNNHLQAIPLPLCYCPNLEKLYMKNNKIKWIPPEIENSSHIKQLVLQNNEIFEIPDELSALTDLQILDLAYNNIVRIPLFVQNLTKLIRFQSYGGKIQTIQCLDWILNNSTIDFGSLARIAKIMKEKQFEDQEMRSLDQNP